MSEISLPILQQIILFLATPFIFGYVANKVKLPAIVGYIVAGIFLGVITHENTSEILSTYANIGLTLLLFTIGLEIDLSSYRRFRRFVLIGGFLQVVFTGLVAYLLSYVFGLGNAASLILGAGFALSSTAIVTKIMQERGEENSLVGQLVIGILIFQDILVIPLIVIIASYKQEITLISSTAIIAASLIKSGIIIGAIYLIGEKIVPIIFHRVVKVSRELLNIFTILFIFIIVWFFSLLGLSPVLAAFVAGLLVGQTLEHYHIFSQMRPLRDIFVIMFFVFLGASVSLGTYITMLPSIILYSIIFIFAKFIIITIIFIYFRFHTKTSYSVGILLSQVGEFAFIVYHQSQIVGLIDERVYTFAIGVTLFSIILSPILIDHKETVYKSFRRLSRKYLPALEQYLTYAVDREPAHIEAFDLENHVVICGFGRVGRYIGRALTLSKVPYVAIDYNYYIVDRERKKGINIIYGDPTDIDILDYAQVEKAECMISSLPGIISQEAVILNAKSLNPNIVIFTRVGHEDEQKRLKSLGAEVAVQPEFEAAISIVRKILFSYNLQREEIAGKIKRLKIEHGMI